MMTDDEIIEVVQANKEGKKIEVGYEIDGNMSWTNYNGHPYDFSRYSYRVAPEPRKPREWICFVDKNGALRQYDHAMTMQELADPCTVRVREVMKKPFDANKIPEKIYCP